MAHRAPLPRFQFEEAAVGSEVRDVAEIVADPVTSEDLEIPFELRDGYEVHRAALARGFNVTLLPRQVMLVESPDDASKTHAFVHGIPESSTLAGVTYAQDRRVRRAILARAGLPIPRGATFSVGRSLGAARRFADRVGYPLVVKPAEGDNTVEVKRNITDVHALNEAIAYFRESPESRRDYVKAAYALTELREPGWENGRQIAPLGYRFLIEESIPGQYLRFLVLGGEVLNVLWCPVGPSEDAGTQNVDVTERVHSGLNDLATAVTRTITGVALAAVDVVVPDLREDVDAVVVEFSERPWLAAQATTSPVLSNELGDAILAHGTGHTVERPLQEVIAVDVALAGSVNPGGLLQKIAESAKMVRADLSVAAGATGEIVGTLKGTSRSVAWLLESLMAGVISRDRPMRIGLRQPPTSLREVEPNDE